MHDAGKVRLLAIAGQERSPLAPDVPALSESRSEVLRGLAQYGGFAGYWLSIIAPRGTPAPVIAKWNAALKEVLAEPDVRKRIHEQGMTPLLTSPEEMKRRLATDIPRWTKVARDNGIQAE
jgi:tripartite-type tricarboxylate transporter receptor subunit TctC